MSSLPTLATLSVLRSDRSHSVPIQTSRQQWLLSSLNFPKSHSQIQAFHAYIIKTGLVHNDFVLGQLLFSCSSLPDSLSYARHLFDEIPHPSPFFYNAMIKGYSQNGAHDDVLCLYALMRARSVPCDSFTFPVVLKSLSSLARIDVGKELHGLALKMGSVSRMTFQTALIDTYCGCGLSECGRRVFDGMEERDVICWNTMVAGYVKCGDFFRARELFDQMPERNLSSWNTLLVMYCKCGNVKTARKLFNDMPHRDTVSWNAMITGYAKIGAFAAARRLFDQMPKRDVVSWNAVITCYLHNRCFLDSLELFRIMQASDVKPDEVTISAVLSACAHLGALDLGQWIHAYINRHRIKKDVHVEAALIDMYGKCGCVEDARAVFDNVNKKNTFVCSALIEVLAMHGKAEEAFEAFSVMRSMRIKPSVVTFIGLLKACSHGGRVEDGKKYFDMMSKEFGLIPKVEHYGCMVDLLGRAGFLNEAHDFIKSMPIEPPAIIWGSLLSACRIHRDVKLAEEVALHLIELEPQSSGNYALLSNIYSKAGRWEDSARVRKLMKEKGVMKKPGCSSIEVNNSIHEFFSGDRTHPQCEETYKMLEEVAQSLKTKGYVPLTSSALHDMTMDEKEQALIHHSEKLAVAFGLISTDQGAPIRIVKNLRVCDDWTDPVHAQIIGKCICFRYM
ncbi:hypothetical protein ACLOJK_002136 [Asimina triloba]